MINRALLKKSLQETKLLFLGCAAWLFIFSWVRVWIVSRMEQSRFQSIIEQFGDLVETVSPVSIAHLVSFTGRIAIGYDDALVVFVILAFAISRGSDVVSGELGRGTMEMVLAQPVSRWQVVGSQALVTIVGLGLLCLATWVGTWAGVQTTTAKVERPITVKALGFELPIPFAEPKTEELPMGTQVDPGTLTPATVNLFAMAFCFAGIATFLSACDRYRWRTIGITLTFLVVQMVTKVIGILVESWSSLRYVSVLTAYEPQKMVEIAVTRPAYAWSFQVPASESWTWGPLAYDGVLLGVGLLSYVAAGLVFSRRDLPAPL